MITETAQTIRSGFVEQNRITRQIGRHITEAIKTRNEKKLNVWQWKCMMHFNISIVHWFPSRPKGFDLNKHNLKESNRIRLFRGEK